MLAVACSVAGAVGLIGLAAALLPPAPDAVPLTAPATRSPMFGAAGATGVPVARSGPLSVADTSVPPAAGVFASDPGAAAPFEPTPTF
jgi:hypothetical protein